jgi:hypothetical protein
MTLTADVPALFAVPAAVPAAAVLKAVPPGPVPPGAAVPAVSGAAAPRPPTGTGPRSV